MWIGCVKEAIMRIVCVGETVDVQNRNRPNWGVDFFCEEEPVIVPHNTVVDFGMQGKATIVEIVYPNSGKLIQHIFWGYDQKLSALSVQTHVRFKVLSLQ